MKHKDPEYLNWIRHQPCAICGYKPYGTDFRGNPCLNAANHLLGRGNDHMVVPLCDWTRDLKGNNCHHIKYHAHKREWQDKMLEKAEVLLKTYLELPK